MYFDFNFVNCFTQFTMIFIVFQIIMHFDSIFTHKSLQYVSLLNKKTSNLFAWKRIGLKGNNNVHRAQPGVCVVRFDNYFG